MARIRAGRRRQQYLFLEFDLVRDLRSGCTSTAAAAARSRRKLERQLVIGLRQPFL